MVDAPDERRATPGEGQRVEPPERPCVIESLREQLAEAVTLHQVSDVPVGVFLSGGLGQALDLGRDLNRMSLVIAVMLVIVAIGLTMDRLIFSRIEAWVQERWGLAQA